MTRCWLECTKEVPTGNFEKLHTRRKGSYKVLRRFDFSAYELDILRDLGINPIFNVEEVTCYRTSMRPHCFPVRPLQPLLLRSPIIEELMRSFPVRIRHPRHHRSPMVIFSKSRRIDGNQYALLFVRLFSHLFYARLIFFPFLFSPILVMMGVDFCMRLI